MLVASSNNGVAMKIAIENQTHTYQNANTYEIPAGSACDVTDFFDVRHQLILDNRETDNIQDVPVGRVSHTRRYASSLISAERVEMALYWFVSAPTLFYLIFLIIRPLTGVMS
jgi:hypothetical protein